MEERSFATTPEELLRHAGWVRALVRELVEDPGLRADVEQETWLAALTRWPRELVDPKGWLRMVTLNIVRQGARGDARRVRRERAGARGEALPSTAELVGHADLQRRVVRAVLELDEPGRTTLLLCFFRGLSCAEIARAAGLPASTVRNRLQRGLAALRARFEGELGSAEERRLVFLAWLAFARPRTGAVLSLFRGGVALLAAGVLVVAGVRWRDRRMPYSGAGAPPAVATTTGTAVLPESPSSSAIRSERAALFAAPAGTPPRRGGRVVDQDGAPIPGALVTMAAPARFETEPVSLGTGVLTDPDGSFALPLEPEERRGLVLFAEKEGFVPARAAPEPGGTVIHLRPAAVVEGRVLDAATEAALAGVRISFGEYNWLDGEMRATVTDERGRFRVARVPAGPLSLRLARPGDAFQARRLFVPGPGTHRFEIRLPSGELLAGRVVDGETGAGLAGARVVLDFADVARSGADGSFAIGGVERSERHDLEASLAGRCVAVLSLEAGDPVWPAEVLVPLFPECVLAGTLADEDGRPLPHAAIELVSVGASS